MKSIFTFCFLLLTAVSFSQGFKKVLAETSGIYFKNVITENDFINGLTYEYLYNGGGVSVADFNNDGLQDIFFTSNQSQNKLYLNLGKLKFKDVTSKFFGKTQPEGFNTGTTVVDINDDGFLDLYVARAGWYQDPVKRRNLLYVNQGGKKFVEKASEYGIADSSCTTQSVFFDADLDGDLDLYLLNHMLWLKRAQVVRQDQPLMQIMGEDAYYENIDGKYKQTTRDVGLYEDRSFGLGVVVSDINGDGYPDIYVTNDYNEPDRFFLNKGDGTFTNVLKQATNHISIYAMGLDIADINNDQLHDIFSVDMASEDHVRSKKNMAGMSAKNFWQSVNVGNHYQYMFNSLQLNMGNCKFAEIAQLAGISKTDWSWAPLIADFDNDGFSDLFITNGYKRDVRDNDFLKYVEKDVKPAEIIPFDVILANAPEVKVPNYIFKNNGDLTFTNKVKEWGVSEPINANGAAYADLDNDGDLDLIVNAMDDMSYIMENKVVSASNTNANYFEIELTGMPNNFQCIGAKVTIEAENLHSTKELQVTRGFQSSVSAVLHFGLNKDVQLKRVTVEWNKNEKTVLENVPANQKLNLNYNQAEKTKNAPPVVLKQMFSSTKLKGLDYKHEELNTDDFQKEILLPNKMSELGPFISKADVNGDKLEDLFVGGSRGYQSEIFIQNTDGSFEKTKQLAFETDRNFEDMTSEFFDADNDGDVDLYVVSGSNECPESHPILQDRLYMNDGKGVFTRATDALPKMFESGQKVLTHDINKDGWIDIIAFGRQIPENYPRTPKSFVLLNQKGKFVDATLETSPDLSRVGMVTDAIFSDFDEDGDDDLIIVGEWMPLTIFENNKSVFSNRTSHYGLDKTVGWWTTIKEYPTSEKKMYIVGNIGANNKFHPSDVKPLQIYMNDFDQNGTNDIVLAKYQGSICYPVRGRECSSEQMPFIKEKFPTYSQFAVASLDSIYTPEKLKASVHFDATKFESSVLTYSAGKFQVTSLPNQCQFSSINVILVHDFNNDGRADILLLGNKFEAEVETVRYDANFGVVLIADGENNFKPIASTESGLYLNYDIKSAVIMENNGEEILITLPKRENFSALKF